MNWRKKSIAVLVPLILLSSFVFLPSYSFETKTEHPYHWLNPGEYDILKLSKEKGLENPYSIPFELSKSAQDAISKAPRWLSSDLSKQFYSLHHGPVQAGSNASISAGDLDQDGLEDLLIHTGAGNLAFYKSHKYPGKSALELHSTLQLPLANEQAIHITLLDLDGKGLSDLFLAKGREIYHYRNTTQNSTLSFSTPQLIYTAEEAHNSLRLSSVHYHDQAMLILGYENGTLAALHLSDQQWALDKDFFPYWEENWGGEILRKGVFVSQNAAPASLLLPDGRILLLITGSEGDITSFIFNKTFNNPPVLASFPLWNSALAQPSSFVFFDVNQDGRKDLIVQSAPDPLTFFLNQGTLKNPQWIRLESGASDNPLTGFFGGSGYHRDGNILFAYGQYQKEIETLAKFIQELKTPYIDEAIYCLANFQIQDLLSYVQLDLLHLLVENAEGIYKIAEELAYVKMLEKDESTTLSYATEEGWKEMPEDIYYRYLVMLNRYLMVPSVYESLYQKNFYRSYLPYDKTYEVTLLSRVKDSKTLYEAAWNILYWLKVDIGGIWHMGEKPRGWYNIYHNLLNEKVGIWCGEWSIMFEAAARAVNIPTIIIVALGEDHQFNNFWDGAWQHVDASAGEADNVKSWEEYIGDSLVYYHHWGQRVFSWPMAWEGNGKYDHVKRSTLPYNPAEKLSDLNFYVYDQEGKPLDGARIELWSHWPMEAEYQPIPFLSTVGYTDGNGLCRIEKVGHQNMTVHAVSRIGSVQSFLPLKETSYPQAIHFQIPNIAPPLFPKNQAKSLNLHLKESYPEQISQDWSLSLRFINSEQRHIPWVDAYFTRLGYMEYWKSTQNKLQVWMVNQEGLDSLLAGKTPAFAEYFELLQDQEWSFAMPDLPEEPLYILIHNPLLTTSTQYQLSASIKQK
ncbi:MAG TPA: hypothetical protein PK581_01805 [Caldisericia bacterium]|nr:hypothetical protein [Caldisericia bacterium]